MNASVQAAAVVDILGAMAETIRKRKEIPNGELYAMMLGTLTLDQYGRALSVLKGAKLVSEKNHLLTWVGPEIAE